MFTKGQAPVKMLTQPVARFDFVRSYQRQQVTVDPRARNTPDFEVCTNDQLFPATAIAVGKRAHGSGKVAIRSRTDSTGSLPLMETCISMSMAMCS